MNSQLEHYLDLASKGELGAAKSFYQLLLDSSLYLPIANNSSEQGLDVGSKAPTMKVTIDSKELLVCFSSVSLMSAWLKEQTLEQTRYIEKAFPEILNLASKDTWLYINPGAECGKEISPWEMDLLRKGPEAIREIIEDVMQVESKFLDVSSGQLMYPELISKLKIILESYETLEEAFMVITKTDDTEQGSIILGFKHNGLLEEKLSLLKDEIVQTIKQEIGNDARIMIVDDLRNDSSANWKFFSNVTPFYIARKGLTNFSSKQTSMERETGLEPATSSLGSWHSTTELLPHIILAYWSSKNIIKLIVYSGKSKARASRNGSLCFFLSILIL
jgi:hypothetical protein